MSEGPNDLQWQLARELAERGDHPIPEDGIRPGWKPEDSDDNDS